jgi:hypothetical protein
MRRSQEFAVALMNLLREHAEILADALEEEGLKAKANDLRRSLGETQVVDAVDHVATRPRRPDVAKLFDVVRDVAAPGFFLRRGHKPWHVEVMCRACRVRAALYVLPPTETAIESHVVTRVTRALADGRWTDKDVRFRCHDYVHSFTIDKDVIAGVFS